MCVFGGGGLLPRLHMLQCMLQCTSGKAARHGDHGAGVTGRGAQPCVLGSSPSSGNRAAVRPARPRNLSQALCPQPQPAAISLGPLSTCA